MTPGESIVDKADESSESSAKADGIHASKDAHNKNNSSSLTKRGDKDKHEGNDATTADDHQDNMVSEEQTLVAPPVRFMRIRNSGPRAKLATKPEPDAKAAAGGVRKKRLPPVIYGVGKRIFRDDLDLRTNAKPLLDGKKVSECVMTWEWMGKW